MQLHRSSSLYGTPASPSSAAIPSPAGPAPTMTTGTGMLSTGKPVAGGEWGLQYNGSCDLFPSASAKQSMTSWMMKRRRASAADTICYPLWSIKEEVKVYISSHISVALFYFSSREAWGSGWDGAVEEEASGTVVPKIAEKMESSGYTTSISSSRLVSRP